MRLPERRYLKVMAPSMLAYVLLVFASVRTLSQHPEWPTLLRAGIALLPVVPVGGFGFAFVRYLRECDEFQRLIELQAIAWAALLVAMVYLALGFLGRASVLTLDGVATAVWLFPSLALAYGITKCLTWWRYR